MSSYIPGISSKPIKVARADIDPRWQQAKELLNKLFREGAINKTIYNLLLNKIEKREWGLEQIQNLEKLYRLYVLVKAWFQNNGQALINYYESNFSSPTAKSIKLPVVFMREARRYLMPSEVGLSRLKTKIGALTQALNSVGFKNANENYLKFGKYLLDKSGIDWLQYSMEKILGILRQNCQIIFPKYQSLKHRYPITFACNFQKPGQFRTDRILWKPWAGYDLSTGAKRREFLKNNLWGELLFMHIITTPEKFGITKDDPAYADVAMLMRHRFSRLLQDLAKRKKAILYRDVWHITSYYQTTPWPQWFKDIWEVFLRNHPFINLGHKVMAILKEKGLPLELYDFDSLFKVNQALRRFGADYSARPEKRGTIVFSIARLIHYRSHLRIKLLLPKALQKEFLFLLGQKLRELGINDINILTIFSKMTRSKNQAIVFEVF